jgi:hypothetical protein
MIRLKKVGVLSLAKFQGATSALIGLIAGIIMAVFSLVVNQFFSSFGDSIDIGGVGIFAGIGAVIGIPLLYGLIGFISGAIGGLLINIILKITGGLELFFEDDK